MRRYALLSPLIVPGLHFPTMKLIFALLAALSLVACASHQSARSRESWLTETPSTIAPHGKPVASYTAWPVLTEHRKETVQLLSQRSSLPLIYPQAQALIGFPPPRPVGEQFYLLRAVSLGDDTKFAVQRVGDGVRVNCITTGAEKMRIRNYPVVITLPSPPGTVHVAIDVRQ
jgi:hypothetical protein